MRSVLKLAETQDGVVAREQLRRRCELTDDAIDWALHRGDLLPLFRGVFAVGHRALTLEAWWRAALLAVGYDAVLSHATAGIAHQVLWRPRERATFPGGRPRWPVHVTVARTCRPQKGIVVHQTARPLHRDDHDRVGGLPVTAAHRTLVDLAASMPYRPFREVTDRMRGLDADALRAAATRSPARRGKPHVQRLLRSIEGGVTRSALERRLGPFLRAGGLRQPDRRNHTIADGLIADAVYLDLGLAIELDSRAWHSRQAAMRADRARDRRYGHLDWRVLRFMPEDLDPEWAQDTYRDLRRAGL